MDKRLSESLLKLSRLADELGMAIGELQTALGYAERHGESRWGSIADCLAMLNPGDSLFIRCSSHDPKKFAREVRNGLNGHKSVRYIRREVRAHATGISVTHMGPFK